MKALIRGTEVITEPFSDWVIANMKWLTGQEIDENGKKLPGDGWTLVDNYIELADGAIYDVATYPESDDDFANVEDPLINDEEFIEINGVRYKRV